MASSDSMDDTALVVDALVVGAGPTGLAAADALARSGQSVAVVEQASVVGGLARTADVAGNEIDLGGHRLLANTDEQRRAWLDLAERLGGVELCDIGRRSGILREGYVVRYPFDWDEFRRTAPWRVRARSAASLLREQLRVSGEQDDESLAGWVTRRYGRYLAGRYMHPHARKVFGIDPTQVPSSWATQRIAAPPMRAILATALPARRQKTVPTSAVDTFLYPRGGLNALWSGFVDTIGSRARWLFDSRVESIARPAGGRTRVVVSSPGGEVVLSCRRVIWTGRPEDLASSIGLGALGASIVAKSRRRDLVVGVVRLGAMPRAWEGFQWVYTHDDGVRAHRFNHYDQWRCLRSANGIIGLEYSVDAGASFDARAHVLDDMAVLLKKAPVEYLGSEVARDAYSTFDASTAELALLDHALREFGPGVVSTGRQGAGLYINLYEALELGAHVADAADRLSGVVGTHDYSKYQERAS